MEKRFSSNSFRAAGLAAFLVAAGVSAPAQTYNAIDIGRLPGASSALATGVNINGSVAGVSVPTSGGGAFLYSGGTITGLGSLPGGTGSYASGINDSSQVVGWSDAGPIAMAFLYSGGTMVSLGTLPGGSTSMANAINNNGQICGTSATLVSPSMALASHAFLYSGGAMKDLGTLGGSSSNGYGINSGGQVVGQARTATGASHAFWYNGTSMIDLGTLPGGSLGSAALGINGNGQIVGWSYVTGVNISHAFLYSGGSMVDLGTLPGQSTSSANAINNTGQVVGISGGRAFLYRAGVMSDLSKLAGLPSGVYLVSGTGITNAGQIAANGSDGHAYLLTPRSGDFNGDGHPDLLWQNDTTVQVSVNYYAGSGGAVFEGWNWVAPSGVAGWKLVGSADFDNNGVPDLVWMNLATRQVMVDYYTRAGSGYQFTYMVKGSAYLNQKGQFGWTIVGVADFDGNGTPDLVWQNDATRQITVNYYGGAGGATLLGWNWLNIGGVPGWTITAVGDFDRNGTPDLVWMNTQTRQVAVNYYGGTGGATYQGWNWLNETGSPGWTVAGANDFDGNGVPDLVWVNDSTRQATVNYYGGVAGAKLIGWQWMNSKGEPGWTPVVPR